jgi:hypothetical protein
MTAYEVCSLTLEASLLVAGVATVIVYFNQLKTMRAQTEYTLVLKRRELYSNMTTSLTADEVAAMMLHVADHFDIDVYRERYAGNDKRIWSYLLMKRKYLFLVWTTWFRTSKHDPSGLAPRIWLEDLCKYQEFQDVHASQGRYYGKFADLVDQELRKRKDKPHVWALEQGAIASEPEPS